MTPRQRWEARRTIALLPLGFVLAGAAAIGLVAVVALASVTLAGSDPQGGWTMAWCLAAAAVAVRNLVGSLKALSAFSWRGHLVTLAWSAAIVAAWPNWWLRGLMPTAGLA